VFFARFFLLNLHRMCSFRPTTSAYTLPALRQRIPWLTSTITDEQQMLLLQQQKEGVQLIGLLSSKADPLSFLSTQQWHMAYPDYTPANIYLQLAKARLTALVTVTALAGYAMAPEPMAMVSLSKFLIYFLLYLLICTMSVCFIASCIIGTALMSTSANTFNQLIEIPYDSQMRRTQSRVLVTGRVTPLHACTFAIVAATTGVFSYLFYCNIIFIVHRCNIIVYIHKSINNCTWSCKYCTVCICVYTIETCEYLVYMGWCCCWRHSTIDGLCRLCWYIVVFC
jgi:hypothetical protein